MNVIPSSVSPLSPRSPHLGQEEQDLFDYFFHAPGSAPGTLNIASDAYPTHITLINYNSQHFQKAVGVSPQECFTCIQDPTTVSWADVQGLGTESILREIADWVNLPPLLLEDIVNVPQRPKIEYYGEFLLIISQMVMARPQGGFWSEQISFILGKNFVLTFQEEPTRDPFNPVRQRLQQSIGMIRQLDASYLCYALLDAIIDNFFPVIETYGDRLEILEESVLSHPTEKILNQIYTVRRELLALRRVIWPQREIFNTLIRDGHPLVTPQVVNFYRDCYDHTIQIIDVIETYRELGSSLMDAYLSGVSNKMNEIMKVLTIISTIFIPLTFIAGLYGMNFNTEKSPYNMPELNWYWGYFICLGVMITITVIQVCVFTKKGWFRSPSHSQK